MVCCVQVTQLVAFLIEHQGELFEEEVAGLAGASGEESPARQAEEETAEVCRGHKVRDNKSLPPQKVGLLPPPPPPQAQARSSSSLPLCKSAEEA